MLRHCAYIVTFVPSVLRWRLAETKPGARRTETSVASVRSSTSRRWFAASTVNMLIRVITSLFAEIVVIVSLPSERGRDKAGATLLEGDRTAYRGFPLWPELKLRAKPASVAGWAARRRALFTFKQLPWVGCGIRWPAGYRHSSARSRSSGRPVPFQRKPPTQTRIR